MRRTLHIDKKFWSRYLTGTIRHRCCWV